MTIRVRKTTPPSLEPQPPRIRQRKPGETAWTKEEEAMPPHKWFPGYMPNPPEDCTKKREMFDQINRGYISNMVCEECPKRNRCKRRQEFKAEWKKWKKDHRKAEEEGGDA